MDYRSRIFLCPECGLKEEVITKVNKTNKQRCTSCQEVRVKQKARERKKRIALSMKGV